MIIRALAAASIIALGGCDLAGISEITENPLTPAAPLVGTWRTALPVTIEYQTDSCGGRETAMRADWTVTWVITATNDPNRFQIEMRYSSANARGVAASCSDPLTGYVPLPSPVFLDATVSSSAVTARNNDGIQYSGSFTSGLLQGTWNHWECLLLCFGEVSASNAFKLVKQ